MTNLSSTVNIDEYNKKLRSSRTDVDNVVGNTTAKKTAIEAPPVRELISDAPTAPVDNSNVAKLDPAKVNEMLDKAFEGTSGFMQSNEYSKNKLSSLYSIPGVKSYLDSLSNPKFSTDPTTGEQTSSFSGITNISKDSLLNAIADAGGMQEAQPTVRQQLQSDILNSNPAFDLQSIIMNVTGGQGLKQAEYTPLNVSNIYNSALSKMGLAGLEEQMAFVDEQVAKAQQNAKDRMAYESSKPQSLSVIGGKQSEIAKQQNEILANLQTQKNSLTNQIKTRYSIVDTIVKNAQLDYGYAVEYYDKQYQQNLSLVNNLWGMQKDIYSLNEKKLDSVLAEEKFAYQQQEDAKKSALANIKVVTDMIADQNLRLDQLPEDQQMNIMKLEVQAGLPLGFTANIQSQIPDGKIISTTTRTDENNNEIADTLIQFQDGRFEVRNTLLGTNYVAPKAGSKGGGGGSGGSSAAKKYTSENGVYVEGETTAFQKSIATAIVQLDNGSKEWGDVWNDIKEKYPYMDDNDIDVALGGGYDAETGKWWGRAATDSSNELLPSPYYESNNDLQSWYDISSYI